jgi:hypothetical protein
MVWKEIERSVVGKCPGRECEDLIVVTDDFATVIDGATDETGARFAGRSGGRFAAEVLAEAIEAMPADVDARRFTDRLTRALADAVRQGGAPDDGDHRWPMASVVCLARAARQVWRIGDCHTRLGDRLLLGTKRVDDAAYGYRAAVNAALLAKGRPLAEILADDPGAAAVRPLFDVQQHLANTVGPWGYGCINGRAVPDDFIEVFDLETGGCEVVLASDGYPELLPTLAESEVRLAELLTADPAAIGVLWSVGKSLRPGCVAPDDKAYLRMAVGPAVS